MARVGGGFLVLAIAGLRSGDAQIVTAACLAMDLVARVVIVPLCFASLAAGLLQSLGTPWGLFRHYWACRPECFRARACRLQHGQLTGTPQFSISDGRGRIPRPFHDKLIGMSRKPVLALLTLLALLFAVAALGKDRAVAPPKNDNGGLALGSGASVTGEVSAVSGNLISLAGGLVTIDASSAKIFDAAGPATIASIKSGATIIATLRDTGTVSTGPLVATAIAVLRNADVILSGTIQSVDVAGNEFLLLSRAIKVGPGTTFVNFGNHGSIAGLHANSLVVVEADVASGALVASRITLVSPIPPRPQMTSGVVKSIGTEAWVITVKGHDTTFVVNNSTQILGSPKAGDNVDVLYTVDSAHAKVALSIIKSSAVPKVVVFTGVVKSHESSRWVITRDKDHKDVVVDWPISVRIAPVASVGDRVEVVAIENSDGTYTATLITKIR